MDGRRLAGTKGEMGPVRGCDAHFYRDSISPRRKGGRGRPAQQQQQWLVLVVWPIRSARLRPPNSSYSFRFHWLLKPMCFFCTIFPGFHPNDDVPSQIAQNEYNARPFMEDRWAKRGRSLCIGWQQQKRGKRRGQCSCHSSDQRQIGGQPSRTAFGLRSLANGLEAIGMAKASYSLLNPFHSPLWSQPKEEEGRKEASTAFWTVGGAHRRLISNAPSQRQRHKVCLCSSGRRRRRTNGNEGGGRGFHE